MRKSQAAMEFLMTYGWAILIIIIALGALAYFGLLNPARFLPSSCVLIPGLACVDSLIAENSITLIVRNGYGKDIKIERLDIIDDGDGSKCKLAITDQNLADGQQKYLSLGVCDNGITGSRFKGTISMLYNTGGGISHNYAGSLVGPVERPTLVSCIGATCTATPIFSYEEDNNPFWSYSLLRLIDGNFITSIDEGLSKPDHVIMGFPNLDIPSAATISASSFKFTHKENVAGCNPFTGFPDDKHSVYCYKLGALPDGWLSLGTYPEPNPSFSDSVYSLTSCFNSPIDANNIVIKITFDPPLTVCGSQDIDYAEISITTT